MLRNNRIAAIKNFQLKALLILFLFSFSKSWGQIYLHDFGTTTISTSPYTVAPTTINSNLSNSQWTSSTGTFTNFAGNGGAPSQALSLSNSSGTPSLTLTFSVAAGCTLDITSFNFWRQRSTSGAQNWTLTINGIFVGSGTVPTTGASIGNTAVANAVNGLTGNVSVVLSLSGASGTGTFRLDDFTLSGSTSCGGGCTPPTTTISPTTQTICAGSVATVSVSSSATSPTYTWQASANGTSGWATVVNGTPSGASYSGINSSVLTVTAGTTYYYQCLVAEGGTCTATSPSAQVIVNTAPSITSQPISVTTNSTGTASYSVSVSGTGLSFQWQENSGSGFSNISNGGSNPTYAGATSSVLTISNPPLSMSGYTYQCVVSNACGTVTTNGTSTLTVNSYVCPFLVSAVVNSCDGCADEGNNEMVVMNSGSYNIPVSSSSLSVIYNNGSDNNFTSSFASSATSTNIAVGDAVSQLNTLAGCSNTFTFVPSGGTIPANSNFIILNKNSCFTGDFSPYCGQGPIYVVISTSAVWSPTGFFGNNSSTRWFKTNFSYLNASCGITTYSYNTTNSFGFSSDGASVTFNGTTPSYITGDGTCVPPLAILPIELIDFYATQDGGKNNLVWKVASEKNVLQYIVEKSDDGVNFIELSRVKANSNENVNQTYQIEDNSPNAEITYYRLSTLENTNEVKHYKIIDLDRHNKNWQSVLYQTNNELVLEFKNLVPKDAQLLLFDLSGKLVSQSLVEQATTKMNVINLATGIYFAKIESPYKIENFKIIIQNDK